MATTFTYAVAIDTLKTLLESNYDSDVELIPAVVNDKGETTADAVTVADMLDKLDAMKSRFATKAGQVRKLTPNQLQNKEFKTAIVAALTELDKPVIIKELIAACPAIADLSNQKINRLLIDLRASGQVSRSYLKKVAYFGLGLDEQYYNEDGSPKSKS